MKNIKELLGKIKFDEKGDLDESLVAEIETSISAAIDEKVSEKAQVIAEDISNGLVDKYKEELNEKYEVKFDEYKVMITEKFSSFVDDILDEELSIPDDIKEFARKGKLYADIIEQFKIRLGIDEDTLTEETKNILREAKDEIITLRDRVNELEKVNIDMKADSTKLSSTLYARTKCDGLTESQKARALRLLEGCSSKEEIDNKFQIISESLFEEKAEKTINEKTEHKEETTTVEKICICPKCGRETTIQEGSCNIYKCPDCEDTQLTDKTETEKQEKETNTKVNENQDVDSFTRMLEEYKKNYETKSW